MRKIIFLVAMCLTLPLSAYTESFDITRFGCDVDINRNGTVHVREMIDVRFTEQRHGIFRTIPFISTVYGRRQEITLSGFRANRSMQVTREGNYMKIRMGDANSYVSGDQSYVIDYDVRGVILTGNTNYDEFYWNVTGNEWPVPIHSTHIEITIPENIIIGENADFRVYAGPYGSTTIVAPVEERTGTAITNSNASSFLKGRTLVIDVPDGMGVCEGVTLQLRIKKGVLRIQ